MTDIQEKDFIDILKKRLPELLKENPEIKQIFENSINELTYPKTTLDRFISEIQKDRIEQKKAWNEYTKRSDEKWNKHLKESDEKWNKHQKEWKDFVNNSDEKWNKYLEKSDKKWNEYIQKSDEKWDYYHARLTNSITAIGAKWGIKSEKSFRNGLTAILEKSFAVEILNINEYDEEGIVFGRPKQIELDIIIKNGLLIICELKSSMSKSDMYMFEKKARYYEKKHKQTANRLIVISPMIDEKAFIIGKKLNIECYSSSNDIKSI